MEGKDMRNLLADALLQSMEEKPLGRIKIKHICAACHISRSTFYYYFDSVNQRLKWLFVRDLAEPFRETVLDDTVTAALTNVFHYIDSYHSVMESVIGALHYSDAKTIFSGSAFPTLRKLLEEDRRRRGITEDDPQWLTFSARALTGMLTELYWTCLTGTNLLSREELVRYAARFYEDLVKG